MSQPFSLIRSLSKGGTTLEALRRALLEAPPAANIVLYKGLDGTATFPMVCPNCGNPATSILRIERAFLLHVYSGDDTPNSTEQSIDAANIPFCEACLLQHRAQQTVPSPWTPLKRVLSDGEGFGGLIVLGVAAMFLKAALEHLSLAPLLMACLPLAVGTWLIRGVWNKTRYMAVPAPTPFESAVDFSPYLHLEFEPPWRAYEFRAAPYADLFRQANADRLWDPQSKEAQTAIAQRGKKSNKLTIVMGILVAATALYAIWDEIISPYIMPVALFLSLLLTLSTAQAQPESVYESLALSSNGSNVLFTSQLLLRGEEDRTSPANRMYRYAPAIPQIEISAPNGEQFYGSFLSSDGQTVAQYCRKTAGAVRPIFSDGLCLSRQGQRSFYQGTSTRISRNGRFLFHRDSSAELRDLDTGEAYPMPDLLPLHTHNALSDNGTLVTHLLNPVTGTPNPNTVALTRPGEAQRPLYEGSPVSLAAVSPDSRYVFLREDAAQTSSLIEIEIASGARRIILQTVDDRFTFALDRNAGHVMIRYYQAIAIWDRATGTIRRLADSPDLILSAVLSDDGSTIAYQRNNGSITRITGSLLSEELYSETPSALIPAGRTAYPGSAVFFAARGFSTETEITIDGYPTPILRLSDTSIQQQELVLQIPWELPLPPLAGTVLATRPGSPFVLKVALPFPPEPAPGFFNYYDSASRSFVLTAALQDFSALVSSTNPAPAGSTIHAYLGALGPLDQPIRTGQPGPANPPAQPRAQITCDIRNLDADSGFHPLEMTALVYAPALVGVYQADFTIPVDWPSGANQLRCRNKSQSGDETRLFTKSK